MDIQFDKDYKFNALKVKKDLQNELLIILMQNQKNVKV